MSLTSPYQSPSCISAVYEGTSSCLSDYLALILVVRRPHVRDIARNSCPGVAHQSLEYPHAQIYRQLIGTTIPLWSSLRMRSIGAYTLFAGIRMSTRETRTDPKMDSDSAVNESLKPYDGALMGM